MITGAFSLLNGAASVSDRASQEFPGCNSADRQIQIKEGESSLISKWRPINAHEIDGVPKMRSEAVSCCLGANIRRFKGITIKCYSRSMSFLRRI
jgi:hypothetical protein